MQALDWLWKDSTTGKSSSTKIIQVLMCLGVIGLCVYWAIDGQLTFEKGKEFVLWLFGMQTAGNAATRGVKAYNHTHPAAPTETPQEPSE